MHTKYSNNELSTDVNITAERKRKRKEKGSPYNPFIREKQRVKKVKTGLLCSHSKTARAYACTYDEAGAYADEIIGNCFPELADDHAYLAFMCRHFEPTQIVEMAYTCASRAKQHEIRCGISTFLKWLSNAFPRKEVRG